MEIMKRIRREWSSAVIAGALLAVVGCAGDSETTHLHDLPDELKGIAIAPPVMPKPRPVKPVTPAPVAKPPVTPKPTPKPDVPIPVDPLLEAFVTPKPESTTPETAKPDPDPAKADVPKTLVGVGIPLTPGVKTGQDLEGDDLPGPVLPQEILEYRSQQGSPFLDFEWLEIQPRVGLAIFSEDFHIDPSPVISVLARVPMPWLTPGSDPDGEYFGVWADLTLLPQVERDLDPEPVSPTGSPVFISVGIDFTLLRNQSLFLLMRYGGQYATYGGVTNLTQGFGNVAGLHTGFYMGSGITLTLGTDAVFGNAGDNIMLNYLGMLIEF